MIERQHDPDEIQELIDRLELESHPEGGHYRRIYTSSETVSCRGQSRPAVSMIHYLLLNGEFSRWHVLKSDECWHHLGGDPLELITFEPESAVLDARELSEGGVHVIPAEWWQAARPTGAYALVTCTVAPGFDFADHRFVCDIAGVKNAFPGALEGYRSML